MSLISIKKGRIIKFSLVSLIVVFIVCLISIVYILESIGCYEYVDNLCYECNDISSLSKYIDYNMLSKDMQKSISKDELDFSNDDSIYKIAECFSERTGKKKYFTYTCTTSSFPHSHLHKKVSINGKSYVIGYTIVFSPRIFNSKPKIVNWKASIFDIEAAKS